VKLLYFFFWWGVGWKLMAVLCQFCYNYYYWKNKW
jgi:hypothetical protein